MKCKYCVCFRSNGLNEYGKCREIRREVKGTATACNGFVARQSTESKLR